MADIRKDKRVLEIVEDMEVFALGDDEEGCCDQSSEFDGLLAQQFYTQGYQQALGDYYSDSDGNSPEWPDDGAFSYARTVSTVSIFSTISLASDAAYSSLSARVSKNLRA